MKAEHPRELPAAVAGPPVHGDALGVAGTAGGPAPPTLGDVTIHKPTVQAAHAAGMIPTAHAARLMLLAYAALSTRTGRPCNISTRRLARELGAEIGAVRKALARWSGATRGGHNGERRRPWIIDPALLPTVDAASHPTKGNPHGESDGGRGAHPGRGVPPTVDAASRAPWTRSPAYPGRGVPPHKTKEEREKREIKESKKTRGSRTDGAPSSLSPAPLLGGGAGANPSPSEKDNRPERMPSLPAIGAAVRAMRPERPPADAPAEVAPTREAIERTAAALAPWPVGDALRWACTASKTGSLTDALNTFLGTVPEERIRATVAEVIARSEANPGLGWRPPQCAAVITARLKEANP